MSAEAFLSRLLLVTSVALCMSGAKASEPSGVNMAKLEDRVRVEVNGKLFTEYFFKDVPRPYCYPLIGPNGLSMTRNWPMRQVQGEDQDHKHHRSLWFAHGNVNGADFWSEEKGFCRTVHKEFVAVESGKDFGFIRSRNDWIGADGKIVCSDERVLRVYARPNNERLFDFEITLIAPKAREAVFGDTKEGTMAVRVAESMRLSHGKNKPGQGHIVLSSGVRDQQTWGKRAEWCDYFGPVEGKTVGIAIFDHPSNPRHPTWWHVRDYGLFAANPFGVHDFEKKPAGSGNFILPPGKRATFRYRFYLHEGDEKQAHVAERYREYATSSRTAPQWSK